MKVKVVGVPKSGSRKVRIVGVPQAQAGGDMRVTQGLPPSMHHMANIEAEGGEVYQSHDGDFTKIDDQAPSHEEGGVMIGDAQRVLEDTSTSRKDKHSQKLKMSPDEINTVFGVKPKRPMSHAEAFEFINEQYDKQRDKFNKAQAGLNDMPILDKPSITSAKLNFQNRKGVPSKDDVFNTLFDHQESIKAVHAIPNDGQAKYGGYKMPTTFKPKAQAGGLQPYQGGATPAGSTTPTGNSNKFQYQGGLDAFKAAWKPILDLDKYDSVDKAQGATYDWLVKNQPEVAASIWKEQGLTAKGRQMMDPKSKSYNPAFAKVAKNIFDNSGKLKQDVDLDPKTLAAISPAYSDKMLGIRSVTPSQLTQNDPGTPGAPAAQQPPQPGTPRQPANPDVTINPRFIRQPDNQFHEGMNWYDLAPSLAEGIDAMNRDPELYNPTQVHQLKYKLLDPTAALRANQGDYDAAVQSLGNQRLGSGNRAANISAVAGQKYKANNQILSQYENQNAAIQNQEITYNTQARDRQSLQDAKSRETFYDNVLKARDNQRLQKLQAVQDVSRAFQLKARQNNSGNLILKMTPAFDQNGNYNGYQYLPTLPDDMNPGFIPQPATKPSKPTSRTTTTFKVGDKTVKTTNSN
jgi:hypothetical protein